MKKAFKYWIALLVMLIGATAMMYMADRIQKDEGNIQIVDGYINSDDGSLAYKLYKPINASNTNKAVFKPSPKLPS